MDEKAAIDLGDMLRPGMVLKITNARFTLLKTTGSDVSTEDLKGAMPGFLSEGEACKINIIPFNMVNTFSFFISVCLHESLFSARLEPFCPV